jgi:hypothetical protein
MYGQQPQYAQQQPQYGQQPQYAQVPQQQYAQSYPVGQPQPQYGTPVYGQQPMMQQQPMQQQQVMYIAGNQGHNPHEGKFQIEAQLDHFGYIRVIALFMMIGYVLRGCAFTAMLAVFAYYITAITADMNPSFELSYVIAIFTVIVVWCAIEVLRCFPGFICEKNIRHCLLRKDNFRLDCSMCGLIFMGFWDLATIVIFGKVNSLIPFQPIMAMAVTALCLNFLQYYKLRQYRALLMQRDIIHRDNNASGVGLNPGM